MNNGSLNKASALRQSNPFDDPGTPTKVAASWLKRGKLTILSIMTTLSLRRRFES
jgi:hypothetical protein